MVPQDKLDKIESRLSLRWPRLKFAVFSFQEKQVSISFDTLARESEENQIRKFIDKFMANEYPNLQYSVDRIPF